ncbi:MAG: outer membrane beta-barrel protein [Cyclobacteriaceae bacterium]|nr:outer membrane beta-barrel protein [Cyclobacteriaceae bacterium]
MAKFLIVFLMLISPLMCLSQDKYSDGELLFSDSQVKVSIMIQKEREYFVKIKASIDGNEKVYFPSDISGYKLSNGEMYVSREILRNDLYSWVFLKVLVKGSANLYSFYSSSDGEIYFLEVKDEFVELKVDNRLSGILYTKLSDCEAVGNSISGGQRISSLSQLMKTVNKYNQCVDPLNDSYSFDKKNKLELTIGASVSGLLNNFVKNGDNSYYKDGWVVNDYKPGIAPSLFIDIRLANFLSFQPEAFYIVRKFANDSIKNPINMSTYEVLDFSFKSVQLNFPLKYRIILSQADLYFKAGFTYDLLMDVEVNRETFGFSYTRELFLEKTGLGLNFGLGYSRYISAGRLDFHLGYSRLVYTSTFGKFNVNALAIGTSWAFPIRQQ